MTGDQTSAGARLTALIDAYYKVWFRFHPEAAVDAGVSGYGHLLAPYAQEAAAALVCLNDELMIALDEAGDRDISADAQLDATILYDAARLENEFLLDVEPNAPDPGRALPLNAIYQLLIRPTSAFPTELMSRLVAIPDHLLHAQDYYGARAAVVPPTWIESAVLSARAGIEFLDGLQSHPKVQENLWQLADFSAVLNRAIDALRQYADFLAGAPTDAAAGNFACGSIRFQHLLRRRHFIEAAPAQLREFGEILIRETKRELLELCREISGSNDLVSLMRRIQADHPAADALLSSYRMQMAAAREFVHSRGLVSIPAAARLEVVETPLFLRHQVPFAAYNEASPNDAQQLGLYYVTPASSLEQLAEHNRASIAQTCVHEAWPGHHLQFVTANVSPLGRRLPRLLNASASLYEGWALYCEQLMFEQGFLASPEQRLMMLRDRLWRALRVVIDVDIHTGGVSLEQAIDRMVAELGFPREQAIAELRWYSQSPTVPSCYAVGWALINAARGCLHRQLPNLTLREFHDLLLSQGSIGLPIVMRQVFGESVRKAAHDAVFAGKTA